MPRGVFVLKGGVGFCNAVRRALLSDLESWAPCEVVIRTNTSCQTDEFIAHRLGMIPFRRVERGDTVGNGELVLRASGPGTPTAADLAGPGFKPVYPAIEIMVLGDGQELDLTVRFDKQRASKHARYCPVAAVGMQKVDADRCKLTFETIDGRAPREALREALAALDARVDGALRQLAHQPAKAPVSMC